MLFMVLRDGLPGFLLADDEYIKPALPCALRKQMGMGPGPGLS